MNNISTLSPKEIAENFNDFSVDTNSTIRNNIPDETFYPLHITEVCITKPRSSFRFRAVSIAAVFEVITSMKSTNSTGLGNIASIVLKTNTKNRSKCLLPSLRKWQKYTLKKQDKPAIDISSYIFS